MCGAVVFALRLITGVRNVELWESELRFCRHGLSGSSCWIMNVVGKRLFTDAIRATEYGTIAVNIEYKLSCRT
jgi:hypothetical protein